MKEICICLLLFLLCCCGNNRNGSKEQQKQRHVQKIEDAVYKSMVSLRKGGTFGVVQGENSLGITITFSENYFFDKHSNRVLFSYLIYDLGKELENIDSLTIQYDFADLSDPKWNTVYGRKQIDALQTELRNNTLLREMLFYSLRKIDGRTVIQINKIMEILNTEFIPDEFTFKGSVFDLMRAYSMTKCGNDSTGIAEQWNLLIQGVSYPKFELKPHILDPITEIRANYCDSIANL